MEIKCDNVCNDLKLHFHNILGFSNYDKDFVLNSINNDTLDLKMYDSINKSKLGKLKNEYCFPVKEFIGLKCKLYSVAYGDNVRKKAKGIKKSCLKNFTINSYKNVLVNDSFMRHSQSSIISKKHIIYSIVQNKVSLSSFYDKKYLLNDSITSRSYGHFLNNIEEIDE